MADAEQLARAICETCAQLHRPGAPLAVAGVHGGVTAHDAPHLLLNARAPSRPAGGDALDELAVGLYAGGAGTTALRFEYVGPEPPA